LLGTGRVPVLITGLDPAVQRGEIQTILATTPSVQPGETILVRMVLSSGESLNDAAALIHELLATCRKDEVMPRWWPLFQGELGLKQWSKFQGLLRSDWQYVNVAVNPFTDDEVFDFLREQVTVAQLPVGLPDGISPDGVVRLATGMKIMGATKDSSYSIPQFVERLSLLTSPPTIIILGPSLPDWSDEVNQARLAKLLPILRSSCNSLWADLSQVRREAVWNMTA
jgi:hypothetical protein